LRLGIYLQQRIAPNGGAFTFQNAILEGLRTFSSSHDLCILHDEETTPASLTEMGFRSVSLQNAGGNLAKLDRLDIGRPLQLIRGLRRRAHSLLGLTPIPESWYALAKRQCERLRRTADRLALDLIWYPDPISRNIDVSLPFFVTVWDLEHRKQPFFPEVSITGWTWDAREAHYSRILPRAATVFSGTEEGRNELIHFYRLDPTRVIVNPFPAPPPAQSPMQNDETSRRSLAKMNITRPFLLYPAQFWPHKNHINLLHSLLLLKSIYGLEPDLVLTGSDVGNLAHVEAEVKRLGLKDRVHLAGFVTREELQVLFRNAEALVFPSLFGPDNLPPLEAFSAGCPVVTADIAGAAQHVAGAALLFDPLSPHDIARKTACVMLDSAVRRSLIARGLEVAAQRTAQRHVDTVLAAVDRFAVIRRNWGREYLHT
jgi:glycosyltransferase involved in cell wall biosynthesis